MEDIIKVNDMEYCTQINCKMKDCIHHPKNIPSGIERLRARNMKGKECKHGQ